MRAVFGLVLIVGFALAGGAVYMAKNYIGAYQHELAKERAARAKVVPTVEVYVANRQLKYGEQFTAEDVRMVNWPFPKVPSPATMSCGPKASPTSASFCAPWKRTRPFFRSR